MSVATGEFDRIQPADQHLGSFVVREGRWLVWHMYLRNGDDHAR